MLLVVQSKTWKKIPLKALAYNFTIPKSYVINTIMANMYNAKELVGKVVTVKLTSGVEVIGFLLALNEKSNMLNLKNPNTVVIYDDEIAVIPFMYTGTTQEVIMSLDQVLTVVKSNEKSETDYLKLHEQS